MNIKFNHRSFKPIWWRYTVVYLLLVIAYFGVFFVTNRSLIWRLDDTLQHVQVLQTFHHDVWQWLRHPLSSPQLWSWKLGLGGDSFAVYSYYCLGDIFSYFSLLFPAKLVPLAFQITILLRLYCVGLAFAYFAKHFAFSDRVIVAGSAFYLGGNYVFYAMLAQPFFLTPLMQFPLLLLAFCYFIKHHKPVPLLLMFTWVFVNSFYFAFIIGLGFGLYLLLRKITEQLPWRTWFAQLGKTAAIALAAMGLTAVLLLPEIIAMVNSTRSNDKSFANGIWLYPPMYYLKFPSQLIGLGGAGFWTSLGFLAIIIPTLIYLFKHRHQERMLALSIALTGIMVLFPAFAAMFNAASSPSNRWLFMAFTPLSLAVCWFLMQLPHLTNTDRHTLNRGLLSYLLIFLIFSAINIALGNTKLNVTVFPLVFLLATWWLINHTQTSGQTPRKIHRSFMVLVVANLCCNAFAYTAPSLYGFSKQMIKRRSYNHNTTKLYAGLDKHLTNLDSYRVSTLANNYRGNNGINVSNALTNRMHSIASYYSVQNVALSNFATAYGNNQYTSNQPLQQVDNRTILNNFLGVKYIFVQSWNSSHKKIPAGYHLIAQVTHGKTKNGKAKTTKLYATNNNFPLLWWTNTYQTTSASQKLSYTQRAAMLSQAVVVPDGTNTTGLKQARSTTKVVTLKYTIVDSHNHKVNPNKIKFSTFATKYKIKIANASKYRGYELHFQLNNISFTKANLLAHLSALTAKGTASSKNLTSYITNLQQQPPFRIKVAAAGKSSSVTQNSAKSLSQRVIQKNTLLNLGYFSGTLPHKVKLKFSELGTYSFKLTVQAVKLGTTYRTSVKRIQANRLTHVTFSTNRVSGTINHSRSGIVTSSIPASSGWHAYIDGKRATTITTNYGFVGIKVPAGKHRITLKYQTPGLKSGLIISLISLLGISGGLWYLKRRN